MLYRCHEVRRWQVGKSAGWQKSFSDERLPLQAPVVYLCPLRDDPFLVNLTSREEVTRAADMLPKSKANEFLLTRAWLRLLLAQLTGAYKPQTLRIELAVSGKPYAPDFPRLHFSLAHSYGLAAVAFAPVPAGVDIEKIRPVPDWQTLAEGLLPGEMCAQIAAAPREAQEREFLSAFTAFEAAFKAGVRTAGSGREAEKEAMEFHSREHGRLHPLPPIEGYVGHLYITS